MKRAFTLVEILVCLAVIAVLSALALPVLARAKASAKVTTCQSNVRQITAAMLLYAGDDDDAIPVEAHPYFAAALAKGPYYGEPWDTALRTAPLWPAAPLRYGVTRAQFHCPLDIGSPPPDTSDAPAFARYGTSYVNDTLGGLVFKTFAAVPDPSTRTLVFDRLGSDHGPVAGTAFRTYVSCAAYDSHVRTENDGVCANAQTEKP